jgi:intracellular sulfur oxidation DsrE/DsrF family protein
MMTSKPSSPPRAEVSRRGLFARLAAASVAGAAAFRATGVQAADGVMRVAYHLSDADKVGFVLGNIDNHIIGAGGPDKIEIVLVVHGPALTAFHQSKANPDIAKRVAKMSTAGVELDACGNTMTGQGVELADLLPGFVRVDQGGVTRLAELQAEGYAYLRP